MKTSINIPIALIFCCLLFVQAFSQAANPDPWVRVQSNDGEFSIEVPVKSTFYIAKRGFSVSRSSNSFNLSGMKMLNSFEKGNLLSFEIYNASRGALDVLYEEDVFKKDDLTASVIHRPGYSIKETIRTNDKFYLIRRYFYSKNNIYILTAASRDVETPGIRRFLDSMVFEPVSKAAQQTGAKAFSTLRVTDVPVEMNFDEDKLKAATSLPILPKDAPKDYILKAFTMLIKPRPYYVDDARMKGVVGTIILKPTFSSEGFVTKIIVKKALPEGLLRQVLFAAMRIKFLPQERDGKPESLDKHIEYSFSIY